MSIQAKRKTHTAKGSSLKSLNLDIQYGSKEFDNHYKKTMKSVNIFVLNACFINTCPLFLHSCNNTEEDVEEVKAPKANFSCEVDKEAKFSVHFKNESQNYSYLSWDFGDKTGKSSEGNPTYTYKTVGIYKVTLTSTNAEGETDKKTIDVKNSSGTTNGSVSGHPVPIADIGTERKQIFYDDFTKDAEIGTWGEATDPEKSFTLANKASNVDWDAVYSYNAS
ncbi:MULTISPECIES: PKD domain-containing protein [unclassified Sphingobacterium]|uniref:PKD domain-containing protein n=1 Tax=unclassified Sphingobacterium TaxID=2609468 RepID=UPI0020C4DC7B|nr:MULTISPECIES: PKD domain-containing protein [unclassified Sphingobacterium]